MSDETIPTIFDTIALAEAAIIQAGYMRNSQQHVWVKDGRTAKVVRAPGWNQTDTATHKFCISVK